MPRRRPRPTPLAALLLLAGATGCQTDTGTLARWRIAGDSAVAATPSIEEVGDKRGFVSRFLDPGGGKYDSPANKVKPAALNGSDGYAPMVAPVDKVADAEVAAAEKLFQQGKLAEAEAAYYKLAKARKETSWGERAQYALAEVRYQRGNLVGANDAFVALVATYPSTPHLEKAVEREYTIGQAWLGMAEADPKAAEVTKSAEVTKLAKDPKAAMPSTPPARWDDVFVGRRPPFDVRGNALQVFEHVRQHDATGPLADKAAWTIATYHLRQADYESAANVYDQLVAEHPKSPLAHRATLASIDCKMKAYAGPEYDGGGLEQARAQIEQVMKAYPEKAASTADDLAHKLDLIADQQAERAYKNGAYYKSVGKVAAAEFSFAEVPARWPESPWAKRAKAELATLSKMPRTITLPSKIMSAPGAADPYAAAGSGGGMGGAGGAGAGGGGMPGVGTGR